MTPSRQGSAKPVELLVTNSPISPAANAFVLKTMADSQTGLETLPDGRRLAIAVYVTDSRANETTRRRVIARIAQVVHQEALSER